MRGPPKKRWHQSKGRKERKEGHKEDQPTREKLKLLKRSRQPAISFSLALNTYK